MKNATRQQLEEAIAENHRQLFKLSAIAKGGEVVTDGGLSYTWSPDESASVLFPELTAANASELLDDMMAYYRQHPASNIGYWSLEPRQPADVGARLLARGFQAGWEPYWMAIDLDEIRDDHAKPEGLEIRIDNDIDVRDVKGLPYADSKTMPDIFFHKYPNRAQRFVAYLDGHIVGHTNAFFSPGEQGVTGLYNVGVLPHLQRKGIGKALIVAACRFAKERGYQYATLNANHMGRGLYEQVGFAGVSHGITWWIVNLDYFVKPPATKLVKLAEAVGLGDIAALEDLGAQFTVAELNAPMINNMTLIQMASFCRQPAAAEWLIDHGAFCTVLDVWDLGWKDRAHALLVANRDEVNRRYYEWEGTLLHIAAMRNDLELAKLALAHHADITIKDRDHDSTAVSWAYYFKRDEMIRLISNSTN